MKSKEKNNLRLKLASLVFLIILAVLYVLIYVAPEFSDAFVETYTAEFGTVDVDKTIDYLCVRNEKVHTADNSGTVVRTAKAGSLKRNGSKILTIGGVPYKSQIRGTVSYYYDGLEDVLTSENMKELSDSSLYPSENEKGETGYKLKKCKKNSAEKGDAVFKIIDNSAWYFVTWLAPEDAADFTEGSGVTVELDDDNKTEIRFRVFYVEPLTDEVDGQDKADAEVSADAQDSKTEDSSSETESASVTASKVTTSHKDKLQVILKCDRYYKQYGKLRYGTARVILSQKTGIVLETSSIAEEDGEKGVYVKNKYGNYVFTPISIIAQIGDKTVVENRTYYDKDSDKIISTVKNYDSIKKGDGSGNVD